MEYEKTIDHLKEIKRQIRYETVRIMAKAGSGHPGGSLSAVEIITVLYFHEMYIDPNNPTMLVRDRFVFSNEHDKTVLYSVFKEKGFSPKDGWINLINIVVVY